MDDFIDFEEDEERECSNETLEQRLSEAIERGEIEDEEARKIYNQQKNRN